MTNDEQCSQGLAGTTFRCVMNDGHRGSHAFDAFAPTNPAHQNTVATLFTSLGAHDLLPMMQLTDADRAVNAARWDREHDAPSVPVIDGVDECWGDHDGCCR